MFFELESEYRLDKCPYIYNHFRINVMEITKIDRGE